MPRVLHLLSQRPSLTGSGVTLDALVRHAGRAGWEQRVVVGTPADSPVPEVGALDRQAIEPLLFGTPELDFPIPGMSDVMPYPSTRFSAMSAHQLRSYRDGWSRHLGSIAARFRPHVIHSHHIWIMSSMLAEAAPGTPVVNHCHATGLRQMELCPQLAPEVRTGCARNDRFVVLHGGHADQLRQILEIAPETIRVVGAGYREELFRLDGATRDRGARLVYIGKYSAAKGLPWLLDAVERLAPIRPDLELHVVGDGGGPEAEALRRRMVRMGPRVVRHGLLSQERLAELLRDCSICVLPSFYEGLPLVLVEAAACGCRLVATRLPGVEEQLAGPLRPILELVPLPRLERVDRPRPEDLPRFVADLTAAIERSLERAAGPEAAAPPPVDLGRFTWQSVFDRIEKIWRELLR